MSTRPIRHFFDEHLLGLIILATAIFFAGDFNYIRKQHIIEKVVKE